MKIQFLNGGLANQIFQYIFVRHCELAHPEAEPWYIDDSFFYVTKIHHGYELERVFGLKPNLLSRVFDPDVWDFMIRRKSEENKSIPQQLMENGQNITMIAETSNWTQFNPFDGQVYYTPANQYNPEITGIPGDYYYHGYWINKTWLWTFRDQILSELRFPMLKSGQNRDYLAEILSTESVAVHVRCGDYLNTDFATGVDYYKSMIGDMVREVPQAVLYVFTDDPSWCRERTKELGLDLAPRTVYVEGNINEDAWQDIVLMRNCRHMILSKSAFAYFAALTNDHLQLVSNPTQREL